VVFPIVIGYVAAFIAFAVGTLGRAGSRSITVQRVAYGVLLLLVAIPPTVLLALAPVLAVAGLALVRVDEREADRVTEFKSAALRPDPPREVEE
jgi:Flp pilus assembly protein protease CpaA